MTKPNSARVATPETWSDVFKQAWNKPEFASELERDPVAAIKKWYPNNEGLLAEAEKHHSITKYEATPDMPKAQGRRPEVGEKVLQGKQKDSDPVYLYPPTCC